MNAAIIVAAGRGTRMGSNVDKLFIEAAGRPVVCHAWRAFDQHPEIDRVVVVIRSGMEDAFLQLGTAESWAKPYDLVAGGAERQDSVWNGLESLPAEIEVVAVHDGARPCVDATLISRTIQSAREVGAAVAASRVTDTIKISEDGRCLSQHLDRSRLWAVQTPQTFRVEVLRRALTEARRRGMSLTDDTAACDLISQSVALVASDRPNPKVTAPLDVPYVEFLLKAAGIGPGSGRAAGSQ